MIGQKGVGSE